MDLSICLGLRLRPHPNCFIDKITWVYTANLARDETQWEAVQRCPGHYMIYRCLIVNHHSWYSGHNSSPLILIKFFWLWLHFTLEGYQGQV